MTKYTWGDEGVEVAEAHRVSACPYGEVNKQIIRYLLACYKITSVQKTQFSWAPEPFDTSEEEKTHFISNLYVSAQMAYQSISL